MRTNKRRTIKRTGNQYDTIRIIKKVAHTPDPYITDLALDLIDRFPGNKVEQLNEGFNHIFEKTRFVKDPDHTQQVRTPSRFIRDGVGNCVDYATFLGSLCVALRIPASLKMVALAKDKNFAHIYTVTNTSPPILLDPVLGQDQNGLEEQKPVNSRTNYFNKEIPHAKFYTLEL
jgi:transglutaminase-like putative cysteine protease